MSLTKVRLLRESKNWNQEEVANKLGMSQNAYSKLESGQTRMTIERLHELAKLFEVEPEYLLNNELPLVNNNNGEHSKAIINTQNYYETQKELVEELLNSKDQQIQLLHAVIEDYRKQNEQLVKLLAKL